MEPQPQPIQVFLRLPEDPIPHWAVILLCLQTHHVWSQKFLHLIYGQLLGEHQTTIRVARSRED
jgi:hypothetical protein